jgi:glutathione S-transferase
MFVSSDTLRNFDKELSTKLLILEILEDGERHLISEISESCQLDHRKVKKYLQAITKDYEHFVGEPEPIFSFRKGHGFTWNFAGQELEKEQFLVFLIRDTLIYQLLEAVIFGKFHSVMHFSRKHFISESTTQRKLRDLKKQLAVFHLRLERGTYHLQGQEKAIRMYLSVIMWKLFRGKFWPFDVISQKEVHLCGVQIAHFFHVQLNPLKQKRLDYLIAATFLRSTQRHELMLTAEMMLCLHDNTLFLEFKEFIQTILPSYYQGNKELGYLFLTLMTREEYYQVPAIFAQIRAFHKEHHTPVYQSYQAVKQAIRLKLGEEVEPLFKQAEGYLLSGHLVAYVFPEIHFNLNGQRFWTELQSSQPRLIAWVNMLMERLYSNTQDEMFDTTSVLVGRYVTVLKELSIFTPRLPQIKIGLMTDLPIFEEQLLMKELQMFFRNDYRLTFLTEWHKERADLLLTTASFSEPINQKFPSYSIKQQFTMADYFLLAEKLAEVQKEKEASETTKYSD